MTRKRLLDLALLLPLVPLFAAAVGLLAVGVPLLVVGMKRKKAAANHSFMPVLGPTQVGLGYALRF